MLDGNLSNMNGFEKFTNVIESFSKWKDIPKMPHGGLDLLHARLRFALKQICIESKLSPFSVKTENSHLCGATTLKANFFNVMVIPGRMYNRVLVTRNKNGLAYVDKPVLTLNFPSFLQTPGVLPFTINDLVSQELRKMWLQQKFSHFED